MWFYVTAVDKLSHSDVWSSWSRSGVAASAASSPLSHAGGVQAGSSPACAGASYGYTIWCTTLVQLVTFGAGSLVHCTFASPVCAIGTNGTGVFLLGSS